MSRTVDRTGKSAAGSTARSRRRGGSRRESSGGSFGEVLRIIGSILGILLGLVIAGICVGAWYASREAVTIMREIASRDVSEARDQVDQYEEFFKGLDSQLFVVRRDEPRNLQNVITYLWTVTHKQSGEVTQFRWEWDMSTTDVLPRSNGALLLDRRLKNVIDSDLDKYDFHDPDDDFAMAIVTQDISLIGMDDISNSWEDPDYIDGVLPPLISPDDAKGRASSYEKQQQEKLAEEMGGTDEDAARDPDVEPIVEVETHHPANPPVRDDG